MEEWLNKLGHSQKMENQVSINLVIKKKNHVQIKHEEFSYIYPCFLLEKKTKSL